MIRKYEMSKMGMLFGTIELLESGDFAFEGPEASFMKQWMQDTRKQRKVSGAAALQAFLDSFPGGSWRFEAIPQPLYVEVGQGETTLGQIGWDKDHYVVKGAGMPTKELAEKVASIEHFSGLSGELLVRSLPKYFEGTDKWAKPVEHQRPV
jgi:hypothetical protein